MGMDVHGNRPTTAAGEYFRNNIWSWGPLADYIIKVAPQIAAKCQYWHSNDGHGLNAFDSLRLANVLEAEIREGRTLAYQRRHESALTMMPDDPCEICGGTGTRMPVPRRGAGDPKTDGIPCNACDGKGHVRPHETWYPFDAENVQEFVTFLRGCGGFKIW